MNTPCQLSILIAAHNCEPYLANTLDTIFASLGTAQQRAEIIIINDASTDATQSIIDDYAARYSQIRTDRTAFRNVGKVRNHAVSLARGEYILMVDSDDSLLAGALQERLTLLQQRAPDILLSKIIEVRGDDSLPSWQPDEPIELNRDQSIERFLVHRDYQAHFIGQFFSRRLFQQHAFPDFICYEDTWLFPLMLTLSTRTLYSRAGFYLYRKHAHSLSSDVNAEKIRCLIAATQNMDRVLPHAFQHLITCHWLDIANRYHTQLQNTPQGETVRTRIRQVSLLRFLLNGKIRLSYKRKMLAVRRRGW
ncbi:MULTISPECIES: glycosyltransferase family 2 protein [unclassified Erwinia]|uniref:glycosyltransferase family 2 protein n=1 Tax=unclassified Erwinia TaxID=2622719 RepID=UPI0008351ED3|nr:glycosyltransferase family 2 protein [Erwinia sp. ErVv1]